MVMAVQSMSLQFCSEDAIGLIAAMSQMCSSFMNLQNIVYIILNIRIEVLKRTMVVISIDVH